MLNSSQHLHHALLASGAPRSFFAIEIPTPSKGERIHHSLCSGAPPDTCFLPNGSQCSHPYLWTRCIPMMGTNTRKNSMTPRHQGVCIVDLTNSWMWFILHRSRRLIDSPSNDPLPILVHKEDKVPQTNVAFLVVWCARWVLCRTPSFRSFPLRWIIPFGYLSGLMLRSPSTFIDVRNSTNWARVTFTEKIIYDPPGF